MTAGKLGIWWILLSPFIVGFGCGKATQDGETSETGGAPPSAGGRSSSAAGNLAARGGVTSSEENGGTAGHSLSSGGTAIASGGADVGGTTAANGGMSTVAGAAGSSEAGAGNDAGGAATDGPLRLVIFYTRWGTSYPEWWPSASGSELKLGSVLAPLASFADQLTVVSGITNAYTNRDLAKLEASIIGTSADGSNAPLTLLTGRNPRGALASGPSLDTALGDCGDAAGPPARLAVGSFISGQTVLFDEAGNPLDSESDPHAAAQRWLGHDVRVDTQGSTPDDAYPSDGAAQVGVLVEALAQNRVCAASLLWGDSVSPTWLGVQPGRNVHELSHQVPSLYTALLAQPQSSDFLKLQVWYATQFSTLLTRMSTTPFRGSNLLAHSVVLWISESGAGSDHLGAFIPVVIASGAGKLRAPFLFDATPRTLESLNQINYTQQDLLSMLARLWGRNDFGDKTLAVNSLSNLITP